MGDYFKPWRRKFGVVTLVMACLFMGLCLRSRSISDSLYIAGRHSVFSIHSVDSDLWFNRESGASETSPDTSLFSFRSALLSNSDGYRLDANGCRMKFKNSEFVNAASIWDVAGFQFGSGTSVYDSTGNVAFSTMPYWSLIIPLTLISAYLLLSKPRKSTSKQIAELATEKVV